MNSTISTDQIVVMFSAWLDFLDRKIEEMTALVRRSSVSAPQGDVADVAAEVPQVPQGDVADVAAEVPQVPQGDVPPWM